MPGRKNHHEVDENPSQLMLGLESSLLTPFDLQLEDDDKVVPLPLFEDIVKSPPHTINFGEKIKRRLSLTRLSLQRSYSHPTRPLNINKRLPSATSMAPHNRDLTTPSQASMPSFTPATYTFPPNDTPPRKRALTTIISPPPRSSRSPSLSFVLKPTSPHHSRKQSSTSFNPITSPRNSPPPDFLLDDDPFADLTGFCGGANVNRQLSGVKSPRLCSMNEVEEEEIDSTTKFTSLASTTTPASSIRRTATTPPLNRYGGLGMRSSFPSIDSLTSPPGWSTAQPQPPLPNSPPPIPRSSHPRPPSHSSPSSPPPAPPAPPHNVPAPLPLPHRLSPAYQRPAFKSRPSLPSLNTLAKMDFVPGLGARKVRKGKVGAGLPFEPWNKPNSSEETSSIWQEEEDGTVTGFEGREKSLPPFPTLVMESASTSECDQDPGPITPTPPTPPPKPFFSSSVFTPSPPVHAHIAADMPLSLPGSGDSEGGIPSLATSAASQASPLLVPPPPPSPPQLLSMHNMSPTDVGAAADIDSASASSDVGVEVTHIRDPKIASLYSKETLEVGRESHHFSNAVLGHDDDVQAYTGTFDDDSYDDVEQFMEQFMEHYDRVDQEEDEQDDTSVNLDDLDAFLYTYPYPSSRQNGEMERPASLSIPSVSDSTPSESASVSRSRSFSSTYTTLSFGSESESSCPRSPPPMPFSSSEDIKHIVSSHFSISPVLPPDRGGEAVGRHQIWAEDKVLSRKPEEGMGNENATEDDDVEAESEVGNEVEWEYVVGDKASNGWLDTALNGHTRNGDEHAIAIVMPDPLLSEPDTTTQSSPSTTPAMTLHTTLLEDDLTCESSTAVAAALATSMWKQAPCELAEDSSSSTHRSNGSAAIRTPSTRNTSSRFPTASDESESSESESLSDDDVPLAKSIPGALTAQTTIRRQVRQEREKKKQDKVLRGLAETTRTRLTTLRGTGGTPSEGQQQVGRPRNHTLKSSIPFNLFSPEDLARKLRDINGPDGVQVSTASAPVSRSSLYPQEQLDVHTRHRSKSMSRSVGDTLPTGTLPPLPQAGSHAQRTNSMKEPSSSYHYHTQSSPGPQRATSARNRQVAVPVPLPANASPVVNTSRPELVVQQRVFISSMQRFKMVEIGESTTAGDVIRMIEAEGSLRDFTGSGGWMVFEVAQDFGMERPIRSFEIVVDVQASWNKDKMVNYLVLRMTPLDIPLNRSAIPSSSPTHSGYIEWEAKRGKWSKRFLQLREHSIWLSKRDNCQDQVQLCSLSNFDAYQVTRTHRAPKPFAFAVKSTDKLSLFENTADYLHSFACSEKDGRIWMEKILVARSYVLFQERHVLFNPRAVVVSRSVTTRNFATVQRPVFEPGSLLSKQH